MEEVSEEQPLRHFFRAGDLRLHGGRRLLRTGSDAEDTGRCACVRGLLRFTWSFRQSHLIDYDGTHAGEIEASEKRARAQLARTADVDEELHERGPHLA